MITPDPARKKKSGPGIGKEKKTAGEKKSYGLGKEIKLLLTDSVLMTFIKASTSLSSYVEIV